MNGLKRSFVLSFIFISCTFRNDFCNPLLVAFVNHVCTCVLFLDSKDQEKAEN